MKLKMERMRGAEEYAQLTGKALMPHEGYMRENDGTWVICNQDGVGVIRVAFHGTAKRGKGFDAPDPVGQAMAFKIIELWNSAHD